MFQIWGEDKRKCFRVEGIVESYELRDLKKLKMFWVSSLRLTSCEHSFPSLSADRQDCERSEAISMALKFRLTSQIASSFLLAMTKDSSSSQ
jgi:hypothetical protein